MKMYLVTQFILTCHDPANKGEIRILDFDGNIIKRSGAYEDIFEWPDYITVNASRDTIFVSDIDFHHYMSYS